MNCKTCALLTLFLCLIVALILYLTRRKWMPAYNWVSDKFSWIKNVVTGK